MSSIGILKDSHGRIMRDLRVSVTERCNFRCIYCLPETEEAANFYQNRFNQKPRTETPVIPKRDYNALWNSKEHLLSYEEIERIIRIAATLGIEKIRLTGGEPLVRRDLDQLVSRVSAIPGIRDIAMTTNGFLFAKQAHNLRQAGLQRVSFSLDSLDTHQFRKMTGRDGLQEVLAAIDLAREIGLNPVKVNAVIIQSLNEDQIESLAQFAHDKNLAFRFIEFMPLDSGRGWQKDLVVKGSEILGRLRKRFDLQAVDQKSNLSETAKRWRFSDGQGEIGIIAPVSEPFCGHCNRLRLTADGKIRTCLFSLDEHDLKPLLRGKGSDADLADLLKEIVFHKEAGHRIGQADFKQPERTMSCIGG